MRPTLVPVLAACALVACDGDDEGDRFDTSRLDTGVLETGALDTGPRPRCPRRWGGALVTFDVAGQPFTGWFTDDTFIDAARDLLREGTARVPIFEVHAGTDCDPRWSFHVDPAHVDLVDLTVEVCDADPSFVEVNLASWIADVGVWCPWSAVVTGVDDRR